MARVLCVVLCISLLFECGSCSLCSALYIPFVSNHYKSLDDLPERAKIGTSSLRRQCQIAEHFPNAEILSC